MRVVRVLNSSGIDAFREYLNSLVVDPTLPPPFDLLIDGSRSDQLSNSVEIDDTLRFANKWAFGNYLVNTLAPLLHDPRLQTDIGLWSWLGLCWFDLTCPVSAAGRRKAGQAARHIMTRDSNNYYRHLVRGPWNLCKLHGVRARAVLASQPHQHGEASESLLSRIHLVENTGLFEAVDQLYVRGTEKDWECVPKARSKGGGSFRRLGKILKQYDRTFDLTAMSGRQIYDLFPREFDDFKSYGRN